MQALRQVNYRPHALKNRGLWANIEPKKAHAARRKFHVTRHYARPDVLKLSVDRSRQVAVRFRDDTR